MEFIFQMFAQMLGNQEADAESQFVSDGVSASDVASFEADVKESPLASVNIFEMVDFH